MSSSTTSAVLLAGLLLATPVAATEIAGLARVNDDATLTVAQRQIGLFGVLVPHGREDCAAYGQPVDCGTAVVEALRRKLDGVVRCEALEQADGTTRGRCRVAATGYARGLDLGAWLLEQGLAAALDDAPVEYHVLERLARDTGRGLWGMTGSLRGSVDAGRL